MPRSPRDTEFSAFVRAGRVQLLRSACLLTAGDVHLAEDLVQTALARLYVAWPRVRRTGGEGAYAHRILVNAFLDETRRPRWLRERTVAEPPDGPDRTASGTDGAYGGDGVDGEGVRAALAQLPPRMRAVVVLRHWLDLGVGETAAILGCSEGTVKSQGARGCDRLRDLLTPTGASARPWAGDPASGHDPARIDGRNRP